MGCRISFSVTDPEEKPVRLRIVDSDPEYTIHTAFLEKLAIKANSQEKDILPMIVGGHSDGSVWLCSKPFMDEASQQGFVKKEVRVIGVRTNLARSGFGYACCKSMEQQVQLNADCWLILKTEGLSIHGVFSGKLSNFAKKVMPRLIIESKPFCYSAFRSKRRMTAMLKNVFQGTHSIVAAARGVSKLGALFTGTTCIIIVHDHGNNRLFVAWTGDRGACIASSTGTTPDGSLVASELTWVHKPWVGEEKAYIKKVCGDIRDDGHGNMVNAKTFHYPSWNITRSDTLGQVDAGVTAGPTVTVFDCKSGDIFGLVLLVFSDAVWDNISHAEALKIVACHSRSDAKGAAEKIAKIAWDKSNNSEGGRLVDDIVSLVIHLTSYGSVAL